jgi:hypothetical protein
MAKKVPTKIQTFEEVQRALQDMETSLNELSTSVNTGAEGEITDKDGKTGDIRVTQNADKTYSFELRTDEGWKFPSVGGSPVQFTGKKGEKARPDAVVDKYKDELGNPTTFPAPDYDSGWHTTGHDKVWITGATTGAIPDDLKVFVIHTELLSDGEIVALPELGLLLKRPPRIEICISAPGVTSFDDAMSCGIFASSGAGQTGVSLLSGSSDGWQSRGAFVSLMGRARLAVSTGSFQALFGYNGAYYLDSGNDHFYHAFDSGASSGEWSFNIRLWK